METNYHALKTELTTLLQAGHALAVRWDCGNDESLLFIDLDGAELPFDYANAATDLPVRLCDYLLDLLELPGVGAFELRGGGRIALEGTNLVLEYQSEYVDYEGDWAAEWTEEEEAALNAGTTTVPIDPEMSEEYSGRQVLFQASI
ncbi:MAG: hypothetical protein ACRYFX_01970 [Janthinobacterium lividum]